MRRVGLLYLTRWANTPVIDFCLVQNKAMGVRRSEARALSNCTIDVLDRSAFAAHHVMVVVSDTKFVERDTSRGLDTPNQPSFHECAKDVINGLR